MKPLTHAQALEICGGAVDPSNPPVDMSTQPCPAPTDPAPIHIGIEPPNQMY